MELVLEFWSLPFQFLSNALADLLVFVAKCLGASWDRLGLAWVLLGPAWNPLDSQSGSKEAALGPHGIP